jgi:hypothetical protein
MLAVLCTCFSWRVELRSCSQSEQHFVPFASLRDGLCLSHHSSPQSDSLSNPPASLAILSAARRGAPRSGFTSLREAIRGAKELRSCVV